MSAALKEPPYADNIIQQMPPWGLAAAARDSLLYGNELRSKSVDKKALQRLMYKFNITIDINDADADDFLVKLMTQMSYEQFPYQESLFEEVTRSHAWMVEGLNYVETKVITEESLASMFDEVPLREVIGATLFLHVGAMKNGGIYKQSWLDQPNFTEVLKIYPRRNIEKMVSRLTTTPDNFRADFNKHSMGKAKSTRFDYNPLVATPFVDMGSGDPVAPATRLILRTVTPGGLYYSGLNKHGKAFADDLGGLFENYIGRQLKLIKGAEVESEIVFNKGGNYKSVDWFVILPGLVILVEVKSHRLGPEAKAGGETLMPLLERTLDGARKQLRSTVTHLADKHPAFKNIPTDRPILGLIVTAEPFHTGPMYLRDNEIAVIPGGGLPDVPVAAVSAREVEWLVTHGADIEPMLLAKMEMAKNIQGVVSLRDIGKKSGTQNPILMSAWEAYPWPDQKTDAVPGEVGDIIKRI